MIIMMKIKVKKEKEKRKFRCANMENRNKSNFK